MLKNKLIGLGLTAVTSATLAMGASPVHAATVPVTLTGEVCATMPAQIDAAGTAFTAATAAAAAAATDVVLKSTALSNAQANLVVALVGYIQNVDAGGSVDGSISILNGRVSQYAEKATDWSNAALAVAATNRNVSTTTMTNEVLAALGGAGGLACPVV